MARQTWVQKIEGEPAKTKMDRLLMDGIFPVLRERPGTTWREVAERVSKVLGRQYTAFDLAGAACYGRKHRAEYGWMVAPVARGGGHLPSDKGRIRVVMMEYSTDEEKLSPQATDQLERSLLSQIRHATTETESAAAAGAAAAQFEPRRVVKEELLEFAEDAAYIARKGARLIRRMANGE